MYVAQLRPTTLIFHVCVAVLAVVMLCSCSGDAPQLSRTQEAYNLLDSARNEQHRGHLREAIGIMRSVRSIPVSQLSSEVQTAFDHVLAGFLFDAQQYASCLNVIAGHIDPPTAEGLPAPGTALLIAHTLKKLGDTALAIEWYRLAEAQISSEVVADINRNLAWLFAAQQQYDSAWARYHRSRELSEQREWADINGRAWWHFITGRLQLGTGKLHEAHSEIDKGLSILENLTISSQGSEVSVRKSILNAVEVDVRRHTQAEGRWLRILERITRFVNNDTVVVAPSEKPADASAVNALSDIAPFALRTLQRRSYPMSSHYMITDATVDDRGWLWLSTLNGLYLMCGNSMIPVRTGSSNQRGPLRSIASQGHLLLTRGYDYSNDTVEQASIAPQDSSSAVPHVRGFTWKRISTPFGVPTAITTIVGTDSIAAVFPSGYVVVRSLSDLATATLMRAGPSTPLKNATSATSLNSDSLLLGTTNGLWRLDRSSNRLSPFTPRANRGMFESIENVVVLENGNVALSSSARYTAILKRNNLNSVLWAGEEANTLLEMATALRHNKSLLLSIERIRTQRSHIDFDRIPPRLRNQIGGSRKWKPSRSSAILNDSIVCITFPGHIGIADAKTNSIVLYQLPSTAGDFDPTTPKVYRLSASSVAMVRDSSLYEGDLTEAAPRSGLTMIACRAVDSAEYCIVSDGGTVHLPSNQRTVIIAAARPRAYGSIDIPTIGKASWLEQPHDFQLGSAHTLSGLKPGLNTITFRSTDVPYAATLRIIVDPALTETWWFWTALGAVVVALGTILALYLRQVARYRRAELERTAMLERVKIGQDLHDAVGADLVRITMILNRPDDVPREELARIAREANRTLRDIIWTSSAPQTVDAVLAQILERIRTIAVEAGLELSTELSTHVAPYPMQATLIRDLVLIVTESITNIIKHARASVIRARITTSASKLHIAISDNGIGFDVNAAHQGMGLPGMRQRAERSGISLTIRSAPDAGSEVELIVSFEGVS